MWTYLRIIESSVGDEIVALLGNDGPRLIVDVP